MYILDCGMWSQLAVHERLVLVSWIEINRMVSHIIFSIWNDPCHRYKNTSLRAHTFFLTVTGHLTLCYSVVSGVIILP